MAFLANLITGQNSGSNFQAQQAPIQTPFTASQVANAQQPVQQGLTAEQQLVAALAGQNGIGNQSQVYNQLQQVAAGQGPNPAQAMLNQATGTNVASQAALAAGVRGATANPGLVAREAAQAGAGAEQNAIGQAATLQANQSLNALGQAGNLAGQQVQNLGGQTNALNQLAQSAYGQQISGLLGQNQNLISNAQQANAANAQIQGANAQMQGQLGGGLLQGVGAVLGSPGIFGGGSSAPSVAAAATPSLGGSSSFTMPALGSSAGYAKGGQVENPKRAAVSAGHRFPSKAIMPPHLEQVGRIYHGDKYGAVTQMPKLTEAKYWGGGPASSQVSMKEGGHVPGKAKVSGDSPKNDTIRALLSPKEVVLPRSVTMSKDPVGNAAKFMADVLAKEGKSTHESDFKAALQRAIKTRKKK